MDTDEAQGQSWLHSDALHSVSRPSFPVAHAAQRADAQLQDILEEWRSKPGFASATFGVELDVAAWQLSTSESRTLYRFLLKLTSCAEYRRARERGDFAQQRQFIGRLANCLVAMQKDLQLREVCLERMGAALDPGCLDRVAWHLREVELAVRVHQAQHHANPEQKLRQLACGLIQLEVAQAFAQRKLATVTGQVVDVLGVVMMYEYATSHLAGSLVPAEIPNHSGLYRSQMAKVEQKAVAAEADRQSRSPARIEQFLCCWQPWQQLLRTRAVEALSQQSLPVQPVYFAKADEPCCCFTLQAASELADPICRQLGQVTLVFDRMQYLRWWAETGTDPISRRKATMQELSLFAPAGGRVVRGD